MNKWTFFVISSLQNISDPATVRPYCNSNLNKAQLAIGPYHLPGIFSQRRVNCSAYFQGAGIHERKGRFGSDSGLLAQCPWINPVNHLPSNKEISEYSAARKWIWIAQMGMGIASCRDSPCPFH